MGRVIQEQIAGSLERREEQIQRYERCVDTIGRRQQATDGIKLSALESSVPTELEKELQFDSG